MTFISWLNDELNKRGWSQADIVKRSQQTGYRISQGQLSHIVNGGRKPGPDACIAIAHALGISREEVFKARGWLLKAPKSPIMPQASPEVTEAFRVLLELPEWAQDAVARGLKEQARAVKVAIQQPAPPELERQLAVYKAEFKQSNPARYEQLESQFAVN